MKKYFLNLVLNMASTTILPFHDENFISDRSVIIQSTEKMEEILGLSKNFY
jgi:hypothetical protein